MSSQLTDSVNDEQERSDAETVDPRVQIELEKLNAATDDINKLEVDLDEARAGFRQLLCESTLRIDALARKLGNCVEKARPYYEARIKAKEALHETQLAAVRFERANSAHAAAKEMVYLAEEGLCTEGRTFDHAWQEMLNHATMRVNESELERTLSEAEHRRTSQSYQIAEIRVHQLQKDLKRSIAKSRTNTHYALSTFNRLAPTLYANNNESPYFELKAQFNQLLEEQKIKVKELEKKVGAAKTSYAEALSNLEQISDEIHRIRKFENEKESKDISNGRATGGVGETGFVSAPTLSAATTLSSSTGHWSDSETTGSPDSESEDQYLQLPDKVGPSASPIIPQRSSSNQKSGGSGEFFSSSFKKILNKNSESVETGLNSNHICNQQYSDVRTGNTDIESEVHAGAADSQFSSTVKSTDEEPVQENVIQSLFSKIVPAKLRQNNSERCSQKMPDRGLPNQNVSSSLNYCTLPSELALCGNDQVDDDSKYETVSSSKDAAETWSELSLTLSNKTSPELEAHSGAKQSNEIWTEVNLNDSSQSTDAGDAPPSPPIPPPLPNSSGDENVNSTPIRMKLDSSSISNWISRSSVDQNNSVNGSRRQSLDTLIMGSLATGERVKEILSQGIMKLNISSLTERRSSEPPIDKPSLTMSQATVVSATKKVPSPLEKSILYLNPEDDSASDSESLASVEMLNDDQISSLMLDNEIQEACQKVLGTPLSDLAASASAHIQR